MSKPSEKIALELTRKEWKNVVDSIDAFSAERQDHSESTNNLRHAKAWMRESEELYALAKKVTVGIDIFESWAAHGRKEIMKGRLLLHGVKI